MNSVKGIAEIAAGLIGLFAILFAISWLNTQQSGSTILWLGAVAIAAVVGYWTGERQGRKRP